MIEKIETTGPDKPHKCLHCGSDAALYGMFHDVNRMPEDPPQCTRVICQTCNIGTAWYDNGVDKDCCCSRVSGSSRYEAVRRWNMVF